MGEKDKERKEIEKKIILAMKEHNFELAVYLDEILKSKGVVHNGCK